MHVHNINRGEKISKNDLRKSSKTEKLQRLHDQIVKQVERKKEEKNTCRAFWIHLKSTRWRAQYSDKKLWKVSMVLTLNMIVMVMHILNHFHKKISWENKNTFYWYNWRIK